MNLQGDFEGLFLTSILQLLYNDQKTGLLRVSSDTDESRVFFKQGTIVYATGSQKEARLGFILRREGIISAQQLEKCLALAREQKLSLGKILVDKGYVSLQTLEKYNNKQVEEILYNLLLWKKGKFEYKDARLNLDGMIVTRLNPMKLILEASRRIDEMSVLEKVITSDSLVFAMSGNVQSKEEIKLNANEWRILSLIDGTRTIRQIITSSGYDEFAVYKILFSLISYGLIEQIEKETVGSLNGQSAGASAITVYNDILHTVYQNLETELGDRTRSLFEEIHTNLEAPYRILLADYHPSHEISKNVEAVLKALNDMDDADPDSRQELLVQAFNQYCSLALSQVKSILGASPLEKILEEIERVIGYVKKYHASSRGKDRVINDVIGLISSLKTDGAPKTSKGLFSRFRK